MSSHTDEIGHYIYRYYFEFNQTLYYLYHIYAQGHHIPLHPVKNSWTVSAVDGLADFLGRVFPEIETHNWKLEHTRTSYNPNPVNKSKSNARTKGIHFLRLIEQDDFYNSITAYCRNPL
jgi:hypothetical protein